MQSSLKLRIAKFASAYELSGSASRMVPMEGMRGLAVVLVFFVHYHALFGVNMAAQSAVHRLSEFLGFVGNTGVDLFFVMSGFLIYGALIKRRVSYFKFTWRRVERIYPTFVAVFVLYLLLSLLFPAENKIHGSVANSSLYILENLLLLPGVFRITAIIAVAWSLSFEFFFYLTMPMLIALTRMREWSARNRLAVSIAMWVGLVLAWVLYPADHSYFTMPDHTRMISFLTGIILYELLSRGTTAIPLSRLTEYSAIALVLVALFLFFMVHHPAARLFSPRLPVFFIVSLAFFFLALHALAFDGVLSKAFAWAPIRYLGNMSYSYYLIHGLTLQALAKVLDLAGVSSSRMSVALACLVIGFVGTLVSSSVLFFMVEKRFSLGDVKARGAVVIQQSAAVAGSSGS